MNKLVLSCCTAYFVLNLSFLFGQTEGFYKDLFMDGGVSLTSKTYLPSADALNLSMEFLATSDQQLQDNIYIHNSYDENGYLLYPDGAPRFAVIYTNGGSATNHGKSMGESGRERIRTFYKNGGSYTGSCAGAYIASISYLEKGTYEPYYHIWPGRTYQPGLAATYTGHFIPTDSPLLDYYDFGGDNYIDNVYHNYGPFAREDQDFPKDTEILLRYDYAANEMHKKASCWAYIEDENSGRIVVIGSHPESVTSGERLDLMKAILLYALDGIAAPKLKATLSSGIIRTMDKSSSDNMPAFAKIGDKQYHHFLINLPSGAKNLTIDLTTDYEYPLNIYLKKDDFAFKGGADYFVENASLENNLKLENIEPGQWYIGVKCDATVKVSKQSWGYSYTGNNGVLNGVAYSIRASWDSTATKISEQGAISGDFIFSKNYPNPFNAQTTIEYKLNKPGFVEFEIHNSLGQKASNLYAAQQSQGQYKINWNASDLSSGIYFLQVRIKGVYQSRHKLILIK